MAGGEGDDRTGRGQDAHGDDYPPIDFNTFILSLSTSALMNMGIEADPSGAEPEINLPLAKQTIDLIEVLERKTRGNLTGEEERLITQVLSDLRGRYEQASGEGT